MRDRDKEWERKRQRERERDKEWERKRERERERHTERQRQRQREREGLKIGVKRLGIFKQIICSIEIGRF